MRRGAEGEGQNSEEQRHYEICGRERDRAGNTGYTRWTLQGLSGRKAGNLKELDLGWINWGRKDRGFGWGNIEVGVNSCFEGLGRRMGLKRVWEFIPKVGKKRNERVKMSSDS